MEMGTFAELLEYHIRENGYTNYEFAKMTGINRVNIQRYIGGARIPERKVFEHLLERLNMTSREREVFSESYFLAAEGTDAYFLRRCIREMLENVADPCGDENMPMSLAEPVKEGDVRVVDGKLAVERFIWSGLTDALNVRANPYAYFYVPADRYFLGRLLPTFAVGGQPVIERLRIIQAIPLAKRADALQYRYHNLRVLQNLIPLYFQAGVNYETWYYYHKQAVGVGDGQLYPYYGIFEKGVVLFSAGMDQAIMIANRDVVRMYRDRFLELYGKRGEMERLVTFFESPIQLLNYYLERDQGEAERYFLEYQPCVCMALDRELAERVVLAGSGKEREQVIEVVLARTAQIMGSGRLLHYFTEAGLLEFVTTGVCADYPPEYVRPLTVEERILVLDRFLKTAEAENVEIGLVNDKYLRLTRALNVFYSSAAGLNLILYNEKKGFRHMVVEESSICGAFVEYMRRMPEFRESLSAEETVARIRQYRDQIFTHGTVDGTY